MTTVQQQPLFFHTTVEDLACLGKIYERDPLDIFLGMSISSWDDGLLLKWLDFSFFICKI